MRSAPQKQPIPTMAISTPSGHGPVSGLPLMKCAAGTGMVWSVRPGRASAGSIITVFFDPNMHSG